jgi:hypothetical protein
MSKARGLADLGNAYSDGALSNRNLIINGAMQVAQRGTSFTANGYGLDRWFFDRHLSGSSRTMSQDTDAPDGFSHSLKYANGSLAEDQYYFIQKIERKNFERLSGQTVTASFYVKASEAITAARWYLTVNGDGTGNDEVSTGTYDITTSWQRITFTVTLGDFSGYTITDSGFMEMAPMLAVDPHPNIPANASLWFTGVQLEVGDTATPFEHRSFGDELARCQRYYQECIIKDRVFCSYNNSAASYGGSFQWRTVMRAAPTAQGGTNAMAYASDNYDAVTGKQVMIQTTYAEGCQAYLNYDTAGAHTWFVRADSLLLDAEL